MEVPEGVGVQMHFGRGPRLHCVWQRASCAPSSHVAGAKRVTVRGSLRASTTTDDNIDYDVASWYRTEEVLEYPDEQEDQELEQMEADLRRDRSV